MIYVFSLVLLLMLVYSRRSLVSSSRFRLSGVPPPPTREPHWDKFHKGLVKGFVCFRKFLEFSVRFPTDREFRHSKTSEWREIAKHSWQGLKTGSKLFRKNLEISYKLINRRAKGHVLTLNESLLLQRTFADVFKLVPFSFFIIVPFAELLLPVALWVWPNMVPSTFQELLSREDSRRLKRLRARKEIAGFFESVIKEKRKIEEASEDKKQSETSPAKQLDELQSLLLAGKYPSMKQMKSFARLFRDEFEIENMPLEQLQVICRMLEISPYSFHAHVVLQLRHYIAKLIAEDKEFKWEGVASLSSENLREACKARGIFVDENLNKSAGEDDDNNLRMQLDQWLQLSSQKDMPISLLLWSRCFATSPDKDEMFILHVDDEKKVDDTQIAVNNTESQVRVEKYKRRVEDLLARLQELESLETVIGIEEQDNKKSAKVQGIVDATKQQTEEDPETIIARLNRQLHSRKRVIDMQNELLRQQLELIARLRDMPVIQQIPRRQARELRSELKKVYDDFDNELKQFSDSLHLKRPENDRFYPPPTIKSDN